MSDDQLELQAATQALGLAASVIIRIFCPSATLLNRLSPEAIVPLIQEICTQLEHYRTTFVDQVPEHLRQRCAGKFLVLEDVLNLIATAHPEVTPGELVEEMRDLTVLLRAQPPSDPAT